MELDKILPVEVVFAADWWHAHAGVSFDRDFFFHPLRRVEDERKMEQALYERWGAFGLGAERGQDLPLVGATHLAAGFLVPEMLGCGVDYVENGPPLVHPAKVPSLEMDEDAPFNSEAFRRFEHLTEALKTRYGYLRGDVNWGGILNVALDLRGQDLFLDMADQRTEVRNFLAKIGCVLDRFASGVQEVTGTSSISVNRNVRHLCPPVFLHSECSHTMISQEDYEDMLLPADIEWSSRHRPFGIHFCGADPHRFAESFAKIPHLDFLDVGWGGDVRVLRRHLPATFLNIRLNPATVVHQTADEIRVTIRRLVADSGDPRLIGVCCINLDKTVADAQVSAIFQTVEELRLEISANDCKRGRNMNTILAAAPRPLDNKESTCLTSSST